MEDGANIRSVTFVPAFSGASEPDDVSSETESFATGDPRRLFAALADQPAEELTIVDFDETLWLRNSTEEFLASVRPRFLAAIVLQILGGLKPWRLLQSHGANHYRDWIRVLSVLVVAPWSLWLWRRGASRLGPRYVNRPLLESLQRKAGAKSIVVSFGFREIVAPLLAAIDPRLALHESCSLRDGARLRKEGKAASLLRHFGPDRLRNALAITDSEADRDLLDASGKGFLVQWPDAHYEQAGLRPLMPFVYLQRVKRPDENYLRNAILGHDLPVLLLAYAAVSSSPLSAAGALLLYVLAFFTAYEIGYHENDRLGLLIERSPKVSRNYHTLGKNFSPAFAWSVAVLMGGVASLLAAPSLSWIPSVAGTDLGFFAVWGAFILFMLTARLLFRWQNVIEPQGRIVPMLGLQVARVLGYALIFPTSIIGALFCVAHGFSRWIPYVVYRFGGSRRDVPVHLTCLFLLTLFAVPLAIGGDLHAILNWQSGLIFAYSAIRAAKDLIAFAPKLLPVRQASPTVQGESL